MKKKLVFVVINMTYFDSAEVIFTERHEEMNDFLTKFQLLKDEAGIGISRNQEHILKSNIVLMQYNILESTFLELYKCLYNYLKNCSLSVDALNKSFTYNMYSIIKRSHQKKHDRIQRQLSDNTSTLNFSNCAMQVCFDLDPEEQKFLVNGNLDGKKIKEFLTAFGIDIALLNELDLSQIQTLKDNRQLLAHGGSSFSEVGKQISWETLESNVNTLKQLFNKSKILLEGFCNNLDQEAIGLAS
ncbi:hypothetical protein SAMN05421643_10324 [Acinetobacter kyonggiensis]|uniref:MAE-28990/MAE-18760-like HEPN domain-containing protein n=2 Tax=Moraxellaceae TaxID=468 RepID=A0A1H3GUJ5_9GAMM|nr:hypothetical protein SAMN05421643_10324 [Acinetobacter kyonggiensis]